MASPTLDSFCCALRNDSNEPTKLLTPYFRSPTYTTVCLVFAIFGVIGASYQVSRLGLGAVYIPRLASRFAPDVLS